MTMSKSLARPVLLCAAMLGVAGCELFTRNEDDPERCNQTYEFGNYGCARIVVIFQPPPKPWPAGYRWDVRAWGARESSGAGDAVASYPDTLPVPLKLIRRTEPDAGSRDTASVWVRGQMLQDTPPWPVGVPLPVFAADSVLHVARFAPVGSYAPVDTVRLTLKRRE